MYKRLVTVIVPAIILCSCTKQVDTPTTNMLTESAFTGIALTKKLENGLLTVTIEPRIVCYSYKDGETAKPCDVFTNITCNLSTPIHKGMEIELLPSHSSGRLAGWNLGNEVLPAMVLHLEPGMKQTVFETNMGFFDKGNPVYYHIGNVTMYTSFL